jgi:signal transduction histidine kinase
MTPFQDPESTRTDEPLANDPDALASGVQREGLPAGFRMRADAHYVDTLDAPPFPLFVRPSRDRTSVASMAHAQDAAVAPLTDASAAVLETLIDDALRNVTGAAALHEGTSAAVRNGAADIISVETHRALRLLTAVRVLRGECPVLRTSLRAASALTILARSIEQEWRTARATHTIELRVDEAVAIDASEQLLSTAVYAVVSALGAAIPSSASRRVLIAAATDADVVHIDVRERGLLLPERWIGLQQPWPVPSGTIALALLRAARHIAAVHGGSLSMHATGHGTEIRMALPFGSRL